MSIQSALMDFSTALAEQGVESSVEVRLGRDGWSRFVSEMVTQRRYDAAPFALTGGVVLHGMHGKIHVRPNDPRDATCSHGIPWGYCTPCEVRHG